MALSCPPPRLRVSCLFQVQSISGDGDRFRCVHPRHRDSPWDLLLRLSALRIPDRHFPRSSAALPLPRALCPVQIVLQPAGRRADNALAAIRTAGASAVRPQACGTIALDRAGIGTVSARPRQEGHACRLDRSDCRCDLSRRPRRCRRGLARSLAVHVPDLFRLFGIFRYRHRLRVSLRNTSAQEFRDSLPCFQRCAVLAALAHHAYALPARLRVRPPRRCQDGIPTLPGFPALFCHDLDHGTVRAVAWGEFHVRSLGSTAGHGDHACHHVVEVRSGAAGADRVGCNLWLRCDNLGFFSLAKPGLCIRISGDHVLLARRISARGRAGPFQLATAL